MPDYIMANIGSSGYSFSVLEVKGRDKPVHTQKYPRYPEYKAQSQNAILLDANGNPGPPFQRQILSLVSVRPDLLKPKSRNIQCRWTNSHSDASPLPAGWLSTLALQHYSVMVHRLFGDATFYDSGLTLWRMKKPKPRRQGRPEPKPQWLEKMNQGYYLQGFNHSSEGYHPFISTEAIELIRLLFEYAKGRVDSNEMDARVRAHSTRSPIFLNESATVFRSGIGLVKI